MIKTYENIRSIFVRTITYVIDKPAALEDLFSFLNTPSIDFAYLIIPKGQNSVLYVIESIRKNRLFEDFHIAMLDRINPSVRIPLANTNCLIELKFLMYSLQRLFKTTFASVFCFY